MDEPDNSSAGPRIIDLSDQGVYVSVENHLLKLSPGKGDPVLVEMSEVAAVLASHYAVTFTRGAMCELARAGAIVVVCDQRSMPVSMSLPLDGFHAPARRMALQAAATRPVKKRLWQRVVRAKIRAQAALLARRSLPCLDLIRLAAECRSGDPANVEAQAAQLYWRRLLGTDFRRVSDGTTIATDENRYLNYGYAVLRALVCRALCGAGLHPGLGIHHHHRNNAFPLADDLMEPFRPLVDEIALELKSSLGPTAPMDRRVKAQLLTILQRRVYVVGEGRLLPDALGKLAGRLGQVFEGASKSVRFPKLWAESTNDPE